MHTIADSVGATIRGMRESCMMRVCGTSDTVAKVYQHPARQLSLALSLCTQHDHVTQRRARALALVPPARARRALFGGAARRIDLELYRRPLARVQSCVRVCVVAVPPARAVISRR